MKIDESRLWLMGNPIFKLMMMSGVLLICSGYFISVDYKHEYVKKEITK